MGLDERQMAGDSINFRFRRGFLASTPAYASSLGARFSPLKTRPGLVCQPGGTCGTPQYFEWQDSAASLNFCYDVNGKFQEPYPYWCGGGQSPSLWNACVIGGAAGGLLYIISVGGEEVIPTRFGASVLVGCLGNYLTLVYG